jgi:hypothetical protein
MSERPLWRITAYSMKYRKRIHLFTWRRSPDEGIARAKRDTLDFPHLGELREYKAEPLAVELTDQGQQYVIPGAERDPERGPTQGSLWE